MAYIQERQARDGKTRFRVQVRLKGHPTQTATFERKTDAKRWAQQTEAAIREGRHFKTIEAKRRTVGEMIDHYVADILPQKPRSMSDQARQLQWWKGKLGAYVLADVTPSRIADCRDDLLRGTTHYKRKRSPATVNRYLAALSHCFTVAVKEWGWLDSNPVRNVRKPQEPRGRVRYLLDEERIRLLQECTASKCPELYPVVILALSTGMRKGEIMGLRWKHNVDLDRGRIVLHETKNDERRVVPLVGSALKLLQDRSKLRRLDTDLVFPAPSNNHSKPPKAVDLREAWEKALERARIDDFRFHDLRHSCASYLAMSGASLAEIAEVLGHRTLEMVKRYAHLSEAHTTKVVERMNARIFQAADAQDQVTGRTER